MYWSDEIELGRMVAANAGGYPGQRVFAPSRQVYADLRSVRRDEFYKAAAAGKAATALFVVHSEDWAGETTVRHGGTLYNIERSYTMGSDVELTCSVLSVGEGEDGTV